MTSNSALLKIAAIIMAVFLCNEASAQLISAKTNALMWGNLTPNLSVELVTSQRTSVELTGFYSPNKTPLKTGLQGGQAEIRYWLSGRPMSWMFVGLNVTAMRYETSLGKDFRHLGDAVGPGLVCGYAIPVGRHWNIEFATGIGLLWYREKKYDKDVNINDKSYNNRGRKTLPTKLSVSCAYVF